MLSWRERPVEYANLFNPAFCSVLLYFAIKNFQKEKGGAMPYPLLFLVLPLVLHSSTRKVLPATTRTKLHIWLQQQPQVHIGFAERTRNLVPYTKESLAFGMQAGIIKLHDDGNYTWVKNKLKNISTVSWSSETETNICCKKAKLIGKWFAQTGEVSTIYTMWGISP